MKNTCLFIVSIFLSGIVCAQKSIDGTWEGRLHLGGGNSLRLVFHIQKVATGFAGTMDSPDQGATGIELSKVELSGDSMVM